MQTKVIVGLGVLIVIVAAAGFYFLNLQKPTPPEVTRTTTPEVTESTGADIAAPVSKMTVEMKEYSFTPSTLLAVKGRDFEVTLKNTGSMPHDFAIPALNVKSKMLNPGQSETIIIPAPKEGMYEIKCTVPGHAAQGMVGLFMVQ